MGTLARLATTSIAIIAATIMATPTADALSIRPELNSLSSETEPFLNAVDAPPAKRMTPTRTIQFQIKAYRPTTKVQANRLKRLDDDWYLKYGEDSALCMVTKQQTITITVPIDASDRDIMRTINRVTNEGIGSIATTKQLISAMPGQSYTMAWQLHPEASKQRAWGTDNSYSLRFFARG